MNVTENNNFNLDQNQFNVNANDQVIQNNINNNFNLDQNQNQSNVNANDQVIQNKINIINDPNQILF